MVRLLIRNEEWLEPVWRGRTYSDEAYETSINLGERYNLDVE